MYTAAPGWLLRMVQGVENSEIVTAIFPCLRLSARLCSDWAVLGFTTGLPEI